MAIELVARPAVAITTPALTGATPGLELSLLQWRVLLIVGDSPAGVCTGRVGDGVGVSLPAASRLARRLEQPGLVDVGRDPDDGHPMHVRLTHVGLTTRSSVVARRHHLISEALGRTVLSAEAVRVLFRVAEQLEDAGGPTRAQGSRPGEATPVSWMTRRTAAVSFSRFC